jgi:hypothetical protein
MQARAKISEDEVGLRNDVTHYRAILRQRTRYYLAQRDAGVPAIGAAMLDLVILGNLEGCFMDVDAVAEVMGLVRSAARERVVELIRAGWIEVRQSETGPGLYATEKAAAFAEHWIGIASAA